MTAGAKEHGEESIMKCEISWLTFTEKVVQLEHVDDMFR